MRRLLPVAAVAAALLALPAAATASRIQLTGTAGPASEVYPLYRAAPGERNRVHITLGRNGVTIADRGVRRIAAERRRHPLCHRRGPRRFFCKSVYYVEARLGDRADSVSFSPSRAGAAPRTTNPLSLAEPDFSDNEGAPTATTFIYGGPGNDNITGSSDSDWLAPGPGADRVRGRGGGDFVYVTPDGRRDSLRGDGGIDSVSWSGRRPVTVDVGAGTGGGDAIRGFERVHGTSGNDTLTGSERPDALYGEGGSDTIDGRGGNDLIVADSPFGRAVANRLSGGDGDDVIDASGLPLAPTTTVNCGAGEDRETGEADTLLDASCESVAYDAIAPTAEGPFYSLRVRAFPVARDPDGPVYEVPCPAATLVAGSGCTGTVALEEPPAPGSDADPVLYGSGDYSLAPGTRGNVKVTLNAAGQAAVAAGRPVVVHVTGELAPPPGAPADTPAGEADFGWQAVLP